MQKYANLVELEKCCRTHIFLQNFVLIQPRTSPPKICKILLIFQIFLPICLPTGLGPRGPRRYEGHARPLLHDHEPGPLRDLRSIRRILCPPNGLVEIRKRNIRKYSRAGIISCCTKNVAKVLKIRKLWNDEAIILELEIL